MKLRAALDDIKQAVGEGRTVSYSCENPHWNIGYIAEIEQFYWEFYCGCGLPDCDKDDTCYFDTLAELEARCVDWLKEDLREWTAMRQL